MRRIREDNFTSDDNKAICFNFAPRNKEQIKICIKKYGVVDLETLKEPYKKINDYKQMYIIFVDSYKTGCYNKDERLLEILDFMNRKDHEGIRKSSERRKLVYGTSIKIHTIIFR